MRRVYYAYTMSLLRNPAAFRGFIFGASFMLFLQLVSVPNILKNFLGMEVSAVPTFIFNAFMRGEVLTLLTMGIMVMSLLSFRLKIKSWGMHQPA